MFTIRNNEESNERGSLMLEAIALLGLMTMMSPMVVRQTAERTSEMEEVAVAGQLKELKDALQNYITANYRHFADADKNVREAKHVVAIKDLAPYVPDGILDTSGATPKIRGNKLVDDFKVSILAQCTKVKRSDYKECTTTKSGDEDTPCYSLGNDGVITEDPGAGKECSRFKMTGLVLSDGEDEIEGKRASRIATMVGADGGYTHTSDVLSLMGEGQKVMGAQGIWEGNISQFFTTTGDGAIINATKGGRIAATTVYTTGTTGDFLYRKKVNGLPDANSMFTDLDMGGNVECTGPEGSLECHRINNAGGVQVINGRIVITDENRGEGDAASIHMDKTKAVLNVTGKIDLTAGEAIGIAAGNEKSTIDMDGDSIEINYDAAKDSTIALDGDGLSLSKGDDTILDLSDGEVGLKANDSSYLTMNATDLSLVQGTTTLNMTSGASASRAVLATNGSTFDLNGSSASLISNDITAKAGNYSMNLKTDDAYIGYRKKPQSGSHLLRSEMSLNAGGILLNYNNNPNISSGGRIQMNGSGIYTYKPIYGVGAVYHNIQSGTVSFRSNVYGNSGSFQLGSKETIISMEQLANYSNFTFDTNGLKMAQSTARIIFNSAGSNVSMFTGYQNATDGNYMKISGAGAASEANAPIGFYTDTGRIVGSYFDAGAPTSYARIGFHANGMANSTSVQTDLGASGSGGIVNSNYGSTEYQLHSDDNTNYKKFRVDPAFVSVMNDIKLTSRGGARLSEALPNYILKGIYTVSNSYAAGKWPCTNASNCNFRMPYYTPADLGYGSGGYEFNCTDYSSSDHTQNHPMKAKCNAGNSDLEFVEFDYYENKNYLSCYKEDGSSLTNGYGCWAHPFMGKVPVPGYKVTTKVRCLDNDTCPDEVIYAQEEGVCPDGYTAVLTVTPSAFEMGRILMYNPESVLGQAKVKYNFQLTDFSAYGIKPSSNIVQTSTRMGIYVKRIKNESGYNDDPYTSGDNGWAIAMGTVTPKGNNSYVWNLGGVPTDSWSATVHTYCYFNPKNFVMPNMQKVKINNSKFEESGSEFLTPIDR